VLRPRRRRWTAEKLAEWLLRPHSGNGHLEREGGAFRERLVASLRAGHALGIAFDLEIGSGPAPALTLSCRSSSTARWVGRILSPAYGRSSWIRLSRQRPEPAFDTFWGRRVREWPDPLREPADGPSGLDSLALVMRGVAPGVSVRWEFSPFAATWERGRGPDDAGHGPRGVSFPRRGGEYPPPVRRWEVPAAPAPSPLFWKASVCIALSTEAGNSFPENAVRRGVEIALRSGRGNGVRFSRNRLRLSTWKPWFPVSEMELACLFPASGGEAGPVHVPAVEDRSILPLGRSTTGRVVGPPVEPDQGRHLTIMGETGMGKSSTLVAVALKATTLGGVVLFDPLGETARSFRSGLPIGERPRLVWVSPQASGCGINALEGIGATESDPVVSDRRLNDLVHSLRRVRSGRYADSNYWGPRLEEMLARAVGAAAAFPGGTLADAHTLLATGGRTRQVVPPGAQEAVRELSDRIRQRPEDAEGARRLLYEVVRSPVLSRMLCERAPSLHAKHLVAPGRIAVISGEASTVGESVARYLLAVYLAVVWSELLERPSRPKTFVVLDESQWFSHESLAEMLRLARRRNVHVVLATQTVSSLPEAVADAVWTNVSDFVAFRGSPEEAREISKATPAVSAEEILSLPRGHAVALLGKGNSVEWLRTAGRPPPSDSFPGASSEESGPLPGRSESTDDPVDAPLTTVETVLAWIRARDRTLPAGAPLRVPLVELRRAIDPGGRAVRAAGARLERVGALISCERSSEGSVWVLDREKFSLATGEPGPAPSSAASEAPQPS
jgi:hypothetical protein